MCVREKGRDRKRERERERERKSQRKGERESVCVRQEHTTKDSGA